MKRKTYQQPPIEVVAVAPTEMITTSMLNEAETSTIQVNPDEEGEDVLPLILGL